MERPKLRRSTSLIIFGLSLALVTAGVFILWPSQTPVAEPVPTPNGYDDILKAAALLSPATHEIRDLAERELREMVTQNGAALKLLRSALERECRVPVEYSTNYFEKHFPELP